MDTNIQNVQMRTPHVLSTERDIDCFVIIFYLVTAG